jgi:hypothetical protein
MKDRDIGAMLNAIETVFPIMTRYMEPAKLQAVWEVISSLERGDSVLKDKKIEMYAEEDKQRYPYARDLTNPGGIGTSHWSEDKGFTANDFEKKFITDKVKNAASPLLQFNGVLADIIKNEPSIPYTKQKCWNIEKKDTIWGSEYPSLPQFFDAIGFKWREKGKQPIMPFLTTQGFYNGVYAAYMAKSFEAPNKWDPKTNSFPEFKAVKSAQVKKFISGDDALSNNGIEVSYPPDTFNEGGDEEEDEDGGDDQEGGVKKNKKKISRRKRRKPKRKKTRRSKK